MLFIFDLDGTLVDTMDLHARSFIEAFKEKGKNVSLDLVHKYIGLSGVEICKILGASNPKKMYARKNEIFLTLLDNLKEMPGATFVLKTLKKRGCRIAIATASGRKVAETMLGKFDWPVDMLVTTDDVENGKPAPDMVYLIRSRFSGPAVMVGDSEYDRQMAETAGIKAFILGEEIHSLEELLQLPEAKQL